MRNGQISLVRLSELRPRSGPCPKSGRTPDAIALRFLRLRVGAWAPLAKALRCEWDSIQKVAAGKRAVTPALALRVARLVGVPMDELLAGQWLSPRVCPHCGHPPDDFADEETVIDRGTPTDELTIINGGRR
jgi:hypothetical protein